MEGRQLVRVEQFTCLGMVPIVLAGPPPTAPNLSPRRFQHGFVGGVLPKHQVLKDAEQTLPLRSLRRFAAKLLGHGGRVIHHLRKDHRPRRRQGPPRPPQMQSRRMPMPDGLLPCRRLVDGIQRQRHLDELLAGLHRAVGQIAALGLRFGLFARLGAQGRPLGGDCECSALLRPLGLFRFGASMSIAHSKMGHCEKWVQRRASFNAQSSSGLLSLSAEPSRALMCSHETNSQPPDGKCIPTTQSRAGRRANLRFALEFRWRETPFHLAGSFGERASCP